MKVLGSAIALLALAAACPADDEETAKREWERNKRIGRLRRWAQGGAANADVIRAFLKDESPQVRIEAAAALFRVQPQSAEARAALVAGMRAREPEVRESATLALRTSGAAGIAILMRELRDGPAGFIALKALVIEAVDLDPAHLLPHAATLRHVIRTSKDINELRDCMVLTTVHKELVRACLPDSMRHLHNGYTATNVLYLMSVVGPSAADIAPLRKLILDEELEFDGEQSGAFEYAQAAALLARCGREGIEVVLGRLATVKYGFLEDALREGLAEHLDDAFGQIVAAASADDARLRQRVLPLLLEPVDEARLARGVGTMVLLTLHDPDASVRKSAAGWLDQAVQESADLPHRPALRKAAADHSDGVVRECALSVLSRVELLPAPFLAARLDDSRKEVREVAAWELARHGQTAARHAPALLARIDAGDVPIACLEVLARIAPNDPRTLKAIVARLDARDPLAADAAVMALAELGPVARSTEAKLRRMAADLHVGSRLWRRYALWKVGGRKEDERALLADVFRGIAQFGTLRYFDRCDVGEVILRLRGHAPTLLPAIDRALAKPGWVVFGRRELEKLRGALNVSTRR